MSSILPEPLKSDRVWAFCLSCSAGMVLVSCFCCSVLYARSKQNQTAIQTGSKLAYAARVDRAPQLDGTLNDPLWQSAEPITDFKQREPYEGQTPTEQTEVRIIFTRHEVYFGVRCHDSTPKRITATELRRDLPRTSTTTSKF
jgi:hypothetical protein